MCGMIIWNFFATSALKCSTTFISNTKTIKKVYYSRLIFFINPILMGLLNFFVQFIIFYFFLIYFKVQGVSIDLISWKLLLIPFVLIYVIIFSLGIGFIVSSLSLKTRDVIYLLNFFFQMYLFLTPVLYPIAVLKGNLLVFNYFNPATIFIDLFKYIFFDGLLIPKIFMLVNLVGVSILFLIGLKGFIKSIKILDDNL
jgi:lipopolysaccharide transport system permease protein